jgi:hypothetical protein
MAHEDEGKMASQGIGGQKTAEAVKGWLRHAESLKDQRRRWFRYVNQRLGEISVMRMN